MMKQSIYCNAKHLAQKSGLVANDHYHSTFAHARGSHLVPGSQMPRRERRWTTQEEEKEHKESVMNHYFPRSTSWQAWNESINVNTRENDTSVSGMEWMLFVA
jgi:hypothetical protein